MCLTSKPSTAQRHHAKSRSALKKQPDKLHTLVKPQSSSECETIIVGFNKSLRGTTPLGSNSEQMKKWRTITIPYRTSSRCSFSFVLVWQGPEKFVLPNGRFARLIERRFISVGKLKVHRVFGSRIGYLWHHLLIVPFHFAVRFWHQSRGKEHSRPYESSTIKNYPQISTAIWLLCHDLGFEKPVN